MTGLEPALYGFAIRYLTIQLHTHIVLAESQGVEPCDRITTVYGLAIRCITILPTLDVWRKAEESNPIPFLRTQFSRLVAGPTPLHYFP